MTVVSIQGAQDHPHQPLVGTHIGWALGKRFARVQFVRDFLCQPFVGIQLGFFLQLNWPRLRVNIVSPQTSENVFFFSLGCHQITRLSIWTPTAWLERPFMGRWRQWLGFDKRRRSRPFLAWPSFSEKPILGLACCSQKATEL